MPDERWLPRFTAVIRAGFFVAMGTRRYVRPDSSHQDQPLMECVLIEHLASPAADCRETGLALPVAFRAIGLDFFQLGAPAPYFPHGDGSIDFHRVGRARDMIHLASTN
jgi:hypothetical protein